MQNRRILEQLEEQKKMLRHGSSQAFSGAINVPSSQALYTNTPAAPQSPGIAPGMAPGIPPAPFSGPLHSASPYGGNMSAYAGGMPSNTGMGGQQMAFTGGMTSQTGSQVGMASVADSHHANSKQRTAFQHAQANSVGYFISQDSSFGNLILPVLPRFDSTTS